MDLNNKLKEQGWYLTEDGLKKLKITTNSEDIRKIIEAALNTDFRDVAGGALPTKRDDVKLAGRIVLQVQKVRNIAAPKSNEESKVAPRLLQIDLSDGQSFIQALELEPVSSLSLNVAPGTKIYFRQSELRLTQGYIELRNSDIQILGGRVDALYEKWDFARTMQKYARSGLRMTGTGSSAPPPWFAFGKKPGDNRNSDAADRNFKSLVAQQEKESKENEDFNAMRTEAIAAATKAGTRKVFGGGGQTLIDHNVKKILDKGYSEEDAKYALRTTHNNLERALYNLKRRSEKKAGSESYSTYERGGATGRGGGNFGGRRGMAAKEDPEAAKPAANVSLFDFLTNKLPVTETTTPALPTPPVTSKPSYTNPFRQNPHTERSDISNQRSKFENNISSSFAANQRPLNYSSRGGATNGRGGRTMRPYFQTPVIPKSDFHDSKFDAKRNTTIRKPTKEVTNTNTITPNIEKRKEDFRENSRRPDVSQRPKAGFESRRGNERQNNYNNQRMDDKRAPAPTRSSATLASSNTNNRINEINARSFEKLIQSTANLKLDSKPEDQRGRKFKSPTTHTQQYKKPYQETNNTQQTTHTQQHKKPYQETNNTQPTTHTQQYKKPYQETNNTQQPTVSNPRHNENQQQQQKQQQQQQQKYHQSSSAAQQQPQQQQEQQQQQNTSQQANGNLYNPNKIIGFQSKETNDFALNLLKSQGVNVPAPRSSLSSLSAQQISPPSPQAAQQISPPPQQAAQQIPPSPPQAAQQILPPPPQAASYPVHNSQPLLPTPQSYGGFTGRDGWMWKIGDLCLAKYWDDGRYYEAEITAISENTCVVFFLGYGNHEEILKSDCLPITDGNHMPINNRYNAPPLIPGQVPVQGLEQIPGPSSYHHGMHGGGGGNHGGGLLGGPQRYRGERQMYVPPHKRDP